MTNPLPWALICLSLTAPGIWLGAGALTALLPYDRSVRRIMQPAVALAGWIVAVQLVSIALHSFWIGLPVGMTILAVAGMAIWWARRGKADPRTADTSGDAGFSTSMWWSMALVTLPIAVMAWNGHFHDDLLPNGHLSMVAQFQNDYFPPRLLGFPHVPLRYHYGFDLVCAGLTALTRIHADTAIRLTTVFGWAYCWCLVWVLGERLTGSRRGGKWTALATLLGGGAAVLFAPFITSLPWTDRLLGSESMGTGVWLGGPTVATFFQHPFALGFPLASAVLLLAIGPPATRTVAQDRSRLALLGLFLAALSLTQVVLFATLSATVTFTEVVLARRWRFLLAVGVAWAAAWLMGGMLFTRIPGSPPLGLYLRFWPTAPEESGGPVSRQALRVLAWYVATFGALLPTGLWGLWQVRRLRIELLLMAGGSLAVPLCFAYAYTADIVKFSLVALWILGILAGPALTWLAAERGAIQRAALAACVAALTLSPVVYIGTVLGIQFVTHAVPWYFAGPLELGPDDRQAIAWLRTRVKPDEQIYRLSELTLGYIQLGGLPAPTLDHYNRSKALQFGVPLERATRRNQILTSPPPDLAAYRSIGITWFVVAPDDPTMERNVAHWEQVGAVAKQAEFGALRVYRVTAAGTAALPKAATASRDVISVPRQPIQTRERELAVAHGAQTAS